ncbi:MAG: PhoH family protein [Clostridia bacterium]|nr:PhoH family protein [Clostridia bacterium]
MRIVEEILKFESLDVLSNLFGHLDENIRRIESELQVSVTNRGEELKISGEAENVADAKKVIELLTVLARKGELIDAQSVAYFILSVREGREESLSELGGDCICITSRGKPVKPKTLGQKEYISAIKSNTITLGIGPAGTGKTYLAVAMAVTALRNKQVDRIVLTRPAVEAGEKLGFLPGDLQDKVDPYLRPLHDALFDFLGVDTYRNYLEKNIIEVAPLAYMRGRTLDDSFIILDEAQNTTCEQMKMFLTRLGFRSKIVITGDITQIDLPDGKQSGLKQAMKVLENIEDISIQKLSAKDVVRHALVQKIIRAYDNFSEQRQSNPDNPRKK